jgi:hypothetical protein
MDGLPQEPGSVRAFCYSDKDLTPAAFVKIHVEMHPLKPAKGAQSLGSAVVEKGIRRDLFRRA